MNHLCLVNIGMVDARRDQRCRAGDNLTSQLIELAAGLVLTAARRSICGEGHAVVRRRAPGQEVAFRYR